MNTRKNIFIDPLSACSLRLELAVNNHVLSTATGFLVNINSSNYLITNWHVLSGRNAENGMLLSSTGAVPDEVRIIYHSSRGLGNWIRISEKLYDSDGNARWLEHPMGNKIDVVALPVTINSEVSAYPLDLNLASVDMLAQPAMPVSIIGFPYGIATGVAFPIWKTGHIASDPDLNYDNLPVFLIDATTRGGMSGSPVILRLTGGYNTSNGNYIMAGGVSNKFLGIYAGRIHGDAEIGRVWRPYLIEEIIEKKFVSDT
ncbi:trypsin-like peptidase domain-containing protein [Paenibacillus lycopersici]|uniref:Trypsin-like peptidase domain-containing protein n=1 Tax=Paenibacillus lycopersici TaxID=2704462 RepID=A0A6C0FZ06_9BACL|nr:serine protease [Paenibacillus lycopersici]QHT61312.1 trypsin-like peptidase domain-containing protein [Paenibacillus lycopersici]